MCVIPSIPCGSELSATQVGEVFGKIGFLHGVRISGGEPFLRADLAEVINRIDEASAPFKIVVSTNATLGPRMEACLRALRNPRKVHLEISLDAMGAAHDNIRGKTGAFEAVNESLALLGPLRSRLGFSVSVSQVIVDRAGFKHYFSLKTMLDPLGIDIFPVIAYEPATALYSGGQAISDPRGSVPYEGEFKRELDSFITGLLSRLPARQRLVSLAKRYYLHGARNRIVFGRQRPNPPCTALHRHIRLNPDGEVPVCMHNSHSVGNLLSASLREVWMGTRAVRQRRWVNGCKGCWTGCEVVPSAIYSGDILRAFF